MTLFIDGDFPTGKPCPFHCSPTCHPMQGMGKDWKFGCTHKAWPGNREGDFVPIVNCGGEIERCDMIGKKFLTNYKRGQSISLTWAKRKVERLEKEIEELNKIINK